MTAKGLIDTGLDRTDRWHRICVDTFSQLRLPLGDFSERRPNTNSREKRALFKTPRSGPKRGIIQLHESSNENVPWSGWQAPEGPAIGGDIPVATDLHICLNMKV